MAMCLTQINSNKHQCINGLIILLNIPHKHHGSSFHFHNFWPQLFGANIPPIFQTFNANGFQANPNVSEATPSTTQHLVPNMSYQVGYTFPGSLGMYVIVEFHMTCGYFRILALYFDTYFTKILWN
jgi:hypothetical protein